MRDQDGEGDNRPVPIPVIFGPTASGKSALAMSVASELNDIELLSADSRQIYRLLDIGTAKPSVSDRALVPHWGIDIIDPTDRYSAGEFARYSRRVLSDIRERGSVPIVVGGTGFYLRALFKGLGAPAQDESIVSDLTERADRDGLTMLFEELRAIDPAAAASIPPNNLRRIVRALACYLQSGQRYSELDGGGSGSNLLPVYLVLMPDRDRLRERIRQRVRVMLEAGLVEETQSLLDAGLSPDAPGLRTIGYREILDVFDGRREFDQLLEVITTATARYAKRQRTWIRGQLGDGPTFVLSDEDDEAQVVASWSAAWESPSPA